MTNSLERREKMTLDIRTESERADGDHGGQDEDDERRPPQPRDQLPHAVLPHDGRDERHRGEVGS